MADLAKLVVKLEAQTAQYQKKLEQSDRRLKRFEKDTKRSLTKVASSFKTILGGVAIGAFARKVATATATQEKAVKQLEAGLASTGNAVGRSLEELTGKAADLQKATTFGDEDIISAQAKLITFTGIAREQFDRTIEAALDLSTRMDQDLKSSVVQLGKALNDPVANLSALSRAGIQFSDDQKDTIKTLAETNRLAEAQDVILKELERQFGGSARAARETFGGALTSLENAFGDLFEATEGLDEARVSVEKLTTLLQDPKTVSAVNDITSSMVTGFGQSVELLVRLNNLWDKFKTSIGAEDIPLIGPHPTLKFFAGLLENEQPSQKLLGNGKIDRSATQNPIKTNSVVTPLPVNTSSREDLINSLAEEEKRWKAIGETLTNSVMTPQEQYTGLVAELDAAFAHSAITQETYNRKLAEYREELALATPGIQSMSELNEVLNNALPPQEAALQAIREQITQLVEAMGEFPAKADAIGLAIQNLRAKEQELIESTKQTEDDLSVFGERAAENIQDALGDTLTASLKGDFDSILDLWGDMLTRMAAEAAAAQLADFLKLDDLFKSGGGSSGGGLGDFFGGFFADGGRPHPGKVSVVGEQGPELFVPDGVSGRIIPNGASGGGMTINNVNNFPGVNNEKEAKLAMGAASRELGKLMDRSRRYG